MIIPVQPGQLANGFCPASYQDMVNGFSAVQTVTIPDNTSISVSATKPADKTKPWLQLDQFGRPVRLYWFAQGAWLSYHPMPSGLTMIWTDVLPNFTTFDGGDANPLSVLSGPMWEVVSALSAKFPLGAGTLPSGTVVNIGDAGGEEKHVLLQAELPTFSPTMKFNAAQADGDFSPVPVGADLLGSTNPPVLNPAPMTMTGDPIGSNTAHNNMPVWFGVAFLRRTTRLYYSVV